MLKILTLILWWQKLKMKNVNGWQEYRFDNFFMFVEMNLSNYFLKFLTGSLG